MPASYFTQIFIKINGQDIPIELMDLLGEVVVDSSLHLPDMFTVLFNDPYLKWVDSDLFDMGNPIEISVETGTEQGKQKGTLIKGEITALEPDFSSQGQTMLLLRGYSKSHRLHRGKKTRTFLKQTDSAIVSKIAGEAGLSPQVDATNITYDYVLQNNQTNMEFLLTRAERIGYQVYTTDGKLYFKKGDSSRGNGPELKYGETLENFRPALTTSHQADKIIVKGWDPKGKEPITSETNPNRSLNQGGMKKTGGDTAKSAFKTAEAVVVNQPISTVDEAKALATGLSNDISRDFIQAEGKCLGDPRIMAGWNITIKGVGKRFSGKYFVTSATHTYERGTYTTTFGISGRRPNTISHLLENKNGHHGQAQGFVNGVVTGLVTNIKDEDDLGRVKVKYAWLGEIESDWVRIATPMAGKERGFFYLPEVNDEVLIGFEHGDVHRPYILGVLWNSKDKPPEKSSQAVGGDGKVNWRMIKSRSGHIILLDDTNGKEKIQICDKTGKNQMVIDSAANTITIDVLKDYKLNADGNIDINNKGNVTLDSKGNITIKSVGNIKIQSTGNLDLQATGMLNIKGNKVTIDGGPMTEVKGVAISINGSAATEVKGAVVKIN